LELMWDSLIFYPYLKRNHMKKACHFYWQASFYINI
jgi:hypothetical protein